MMLTAVACGYPAPLNALQILYANIVSILLYTHNTYGTPNLHLTHTLTHTMLPPIKP
jgi:hypothetical protein